VQRQVTYLPDIARGDFAFDTRLYVTLGLFLVLVADDTFSSSPTT